MEPLLFLAHRIPYPPTKGDKVRSYHFLRHLATRYRVFLGTFVDDPADLEHIDALRAICAEVHVERIERRAMRVRGLAALLRGAPVTLDYFRSRNLRAWVEGVTARERIRTAFAYSSPMAQYLLGMSHVRRVADFVDLDSAKWSSYAERHRWPMSALYRREATRLLAFEREVAARIEATLFVTGDEAQLLAAAAPESAQRIFAIENGVDSDYFSPAHTFESPFEAAEHPIVFTGAMDYWPNVDAVTWFAREVLPRVRQRDNRARFHIVGMNPDRAVRALEGDAVNVTGRVADVRPYLCHASAIVAPLRVARGIQNKVLEAMAMGRPVVATTASAAALSAQPGIELEVADDADVFAARVLGAMVPVHGAELGARARARVLADYQWSARLARLDDLLARSPPRSVAPSVTRVPPHGTRRPVSAR